MAFLLTGDESGLIWAVCATAITRLVRNSRLVAIFYGLPYFTGMFFFLLLSRISVAQGKAVLAGNLCMMAGF